MATLLEMAVEIVASHASTTNMTKDELNCRNRKRLSGTVSSHIELIKTGRLFSECVREVNETLSLNWI